MPYSAQRDLTGKHPLDVFPFLVMADNTGSLYDGTGSQITSLNITASNSVSASYEVMYELSSSYANFADSSSYTTSASFSSASFSASYAGSSSVVVSGSFSFFATSGSATKYAVSSSQSDFSTSGSEALFAPSSSHSDTATSSSNAQTASYISPSFGVVSNVSNATGSSAGTAGFTDAAELGAFILAVSSSFQTLNTLISDLRASGVIT